ncbi:MAG TPA: hypothetical protein VEK33_09315 [Terriglobales bacterium]|nr:hypothetical protein [Terriglobales bacterium]
MRSYRVVLALFLFFSTLAMTTGTMHSQEKDSVGTAQVHAVITNQAQREDNEAPLLQPGDVKVKQGKNFLKMTQLIPARGDNGALQMFVLIDDTLDSRIGNNLNDLRDFINAQSASTLIGIGYMSNATVNVVQNFTSDHAVVAKAARLPLGRLSTMDSPYLSLISLVKGWKQQNVRREVLMVTDGMDRLHGEKPSVSRLGPRFGSVYHSMPTMSPDVDSASEVSQRYNVLVYSIYATSVGRAARSSWDLELGLSALSKLADETGGDVFSLGTSSLVSFKPYLERLQKYLGNQYYAVFQAITGKKPGLQRVNFATEAPNAEIAAADNVWVPTGNTSQSASGSP